MSKKLDSLNERLSKATTERDETSKKIDELQAELATAKADGKPYAKIQKSIDSATKKNNKAAERVEKIEEQIAAASEEKTRKSEKAFNAETFKPISRGTIRATLAEGFMAGKTFKDLAEETGTSEGNIRTHLQNMVNFNGFGYIIEDGKVTLLIPEGMEMFQDKPEPKKKAPKKEAENTSEGVDSENTPFEETTAEPATDAADGSAE